MRNVTRACTATGILLILSSGAWAANSVSVGAVTATVGDSVTIPISITTDQELTLLSVDITTDPSLCGMIAQQNVLKGPIANKDPEEGGEQCPTTRVVLFDLSAVPVIRPGSGVIAEWTFNVRPDAAGGVFPLRLSVNHSRNGPATVPLTPVSGQLILVPQVGAAPGSEPAPVAVAPAGQPVAPVEPRVGAPVESGTKLAPGAEPGPTGRPMALAAVPATPPSENDGGPIAGGAPPAAEPVAATPGAAAAPVPEARTPESEARAQAGVTAGASPAATPQSAETPRTPTVAQAPTNTAVPVPTRTPPSTPTATRAPARSGSCAIAGPGRDRRCGAVLLIAMMFLIVRKRRG